ncbi:putative regulatory prophage protein [Yersinia enterocolitica]|nr:putative regulatory prophage protein [Yersinia enterocolitica]
MTSRRSICISITMEKKLTHWCCVIGGCEVSDEDSPYEAELAGIQRLTANHIALWQSIRSRTASGEACTKSLVRDDMRGMGFDVAKKFTRWLDKLEIDGLIHIDGENICPNSLSNTARN